MVVRRSFQFIDEPEIQEQLGFPPGCKALDLIHTLVNFLGSMGVLLSCTRVFLILQRKGSCPCEAFCEVGYCGNIRNALYFFFFALGVFKP